MINQVKRNDLESLDWPPITQNEKSSVAEQGAVRLSDQVSEAFWACSLGVRLPLAQANSVQKQHSRSHRASLTACSGEVCPEATWARSLEVRL